jgi:hypothetical protein
VNTVEIRAMFEKWYLAVAKGDPANLLKTAQGEYLRPATSVPYMAFETAIHIAQMIAKAEHDKSKAINAELLEALKDSWNPALPVLDREIKACAAITKATQGEVK